MKRPGTRASYERLLRRIRQRVPGVTLRTTFIVGFPGETDADVDELAGFLMPFSSTTSASSPTPTRRAHPRAPGSTTTCRRRSSGRGGTALMALQKRIVRGSQKRRIGQRVRLRRGRPVRRARPGGPGPAGRPGARDRRAGVSDRVRPVFAPAGHVHRRRNRRRRGLRPDRPSIAATQTRVVA